MIVHIRRGSGQLELHNGRFGESSWDTNDVANTLYNRSNS